MCDDGKHCCRGLHRTASIGSIWMIGWLFTLGILHLPLLKALLAVLVWPYFLGCAFRLPGL
jgi:hypothetical protein